MSREGTGTPVVDLVLAEYRRGTGWDADMRQVGDTLDMMTGSESRSMDLLRARDAKGRATYGHPLRSDNRKPDGSRYDWRQEAAEELADALLYLRAAREEEKGHE